MKSSNMVKKGKRLKTQGDVLPKQFLLGFFVEVI